jgi:glycosyltransferase involved in cell wall biosynthesis
MKILHVYKDYFPILGGIENHVRILAQGQAECGHQVTILVTHPNSMQTHFADENGVHVIRAGRLATIASTPLSLALPWQLLHEQPAVVHLHFPYPVGEVSQWLLRRGQATVLSYHSDIVRQAGILRFYRPLLRRVLAAVDAIIIGSPPMRSSAFLADHQAKLHLIPYGIPLARFKTRPTAETLARLREHYLVPHTGQSASVTASEPPVLLFVGRLRYYKGLDTLIRALPEISARLLVVGVGPMEAEWKTLAEVNGVSDRVAWLGEVPDADLPALYHLADLFVLPASHSSEAFGLVQVEAMAAGVPVVCTELGTGTSYVNQDGVTGCVVPPRDPAALAAAISTLLADPAKLSAMATSARARVEAEFEQTVMVERVLATYQRIVA